MTTYSHVHQGAVEAAGGVVEEREGAAPTRARGGEGEGERVERD